MRSIRDIPEADMDKIPSSKPEIYVTHKNKDDREFREPVFIAKCCDEGWLFLFGDNR